MNKNPNPGTRFRKGQSGNKSGRPKDLLTRDKVKQVVSKYLDLPSDQIKILIEENKIPALDMIIVKMIDKGMEYGDCGRWNGLLDRCVGRVKDELEVTTPKPYIIRRRDGTEIEMGAIVESREE
jgi:hypothetical protein